MSDELELAKLRAETARRRAWAGPRPRKSPPLLPCGVCSALDRGEGAWPGDLAVVERATTWSLTSARSRKLHLPVRRVRWKRGRQHRKGEWMALCGKRYLRWRVDVPFPRIALPAGSTNPPITVPGAVES